MAKKLSELKFFVDENVDFNIVKDLKKKGLKIISVSEKLSGISDRQLLDIARKDKSIIITEDKDFEE